MVLLTRPSLARRREESDRQALEPLDDALTPGQDVRPSKRETLKGAGRPGIVDQLTELEVLKQHGCAWYGYAAASLDLVCRDSTIEARCADALQQLHALRL